MTKKILTLLGFLYLMPINSAQAMELHYFSTYQHFSTVGLNYVALGLRAKFKHFSFDISQGAKISDRSEREANEWSNGTSLAMNIYPFHSSNSNRRFIFSYQHVSDIFRGRPFNGKEEPVDDFIGLGFSFMQDKYETELMFGIESHDCNLSTNCAWANQAKLTFKYFL